MKAISVRNPWAHLILSGEKWVEVRSWQTDYRGKLLICSSANPKIKGTISGCGLIVCDLVDIVPFTKEFLEGACLDEMPPAGHFAWVLDNFQMIKPFPLKGKLSLYEVDDSMIEFIDDSDLTDEQLEEVFEQYFKPLLHK